MSQTVTEQPTPPLRSETVLTNAQAVLVNNDRGTHSVPTQGLYDFRWAWDSNFIAVGLAKINERRAWVEVKASISSQWPSGMVPHIDFQEKDPEGSAYFPGADIWQSRHRRTSGITQPTLTAQTALKIYKESKDPEFAKQMLAELYGDMMRQHRWLYDVRAAGDTGLLLCTHPWETGMDNSPAWEDALSHIEIGDLPPYERQDNKRGIAAHRPSKTFYDQAYRLLIDARNHGYDTREATDASQFAVIDVGFNSLAVEASAALVEIGEILGQDTSEAQGWLQKGETWLKTLWNPTLGTFTSYDWKNKKDIPIATSAGFFPLITNAPDEKQVGRLTMLANDWRRKAKGLGDGPGFLIPSTDPAHPAFNEIIYWKGPVWVLPNYVAANGFEKHGRHRMAKDIRTDIVNLVGTAGNREYFHPNTGEGLGGDNFGWTAGIIYGGIDRELMREVLDGPSPEMAPGFDKHVPELSRSSL